MQVVSRIQVIVTQSSHARNSKFPIICAAHCLTCSKKEVCSTPVRRELIYLCAYGLMELFSPETETFHSFSLLIPQESAEG